MHAAATPRSTRVALVGATLLLYGFLFWALFPSMGASAAVFGSVPALLAGWLLGTRVGLVAAGVAVLLPVLLLAWQGRDIWGVLFGSEGVADTLLPLPLAFGAGWAGETNRALQAERERVERLLHTILPEAVAARLQQEPQAIADHFDAVTVLFADIVDFSTLAGHLSPRKLVRLLNEIFSAFDALAARHGLEKIKTIGDTYMAAAGVPLPRPDHAEAIADLALEMLPELERLNQDHGTALRLRIGIASGPVVAGVIGTHKYSYDLWGNTVNVASRMESHGIPGHIQVTAETFERLRPRYRLVKRGKVEIKGKGAMRTYLLLGPRDAQETNS